MNLQSDLKKINDLFKKNYFLDSQGCSKISRSFKTFLDKTNKKSDKRFKY